MRKLLLLSAIGLLAVAQAGLAQAATLGPDLATDGLTYNFSIIGGALNSTSATFQVEITGINVVGTDTIGGRSGINAFAFTTANLPTILSGSTTLVGATFQSGGLNSGGCNGSGGFFCFGNTNVANTPALASGTVIDIDFSLNLASGNFLAWDPSFKIDWNGSQNNYSLVSETIPLGPNGTPFSVPPGETPLPAAVWLMGSVLGGGALVMRRRKKKQAALLAA
jgi:LPXTG-motif cell wall-anchored protein